MIGKTLGHYRVGEQLGRGGMGEVFLADDLSLSRKVALKFLPDLFTGDPDRMARFEREAKLLAALNHPNIGAIYGLEQAEGKRFLVLELVEGETLADQLKRGPIPVEESLRIALQIAEALEAAHEKGVIHRDLKPANIMVKPDGKVKVLDFGLAKALADEQAELNLSNSPTLSVAATRQGIILGTAAYMSPEQARGKTVDKRADIWAFGCVLYEMLTGQAAFQGEDVTEILASVVKGGANLELLPPNTHPRLRELLSRCLQKEMKRRYQDIGDLRFELEQVGADPSGVLVQPATAVEPGTKLRAVLPWVAASVVLSAIIVGVAVWNLKPAPPPEPRLATRLYYELPKNQEFGNLLDSNIAVSHDGQQLVYGTKGGLYLRSMDELDARLIPGTETNPQRPFFSPDGKWIGYFSGLDNQVKKVAISGGAPLTLTVATDSSGSFCWNPDDTIVYGELRRGIMRVSANGGRPEAIVKEEKAPPRHPQILPDGKSVLFTLGPPPFKIVVQSLQSGERKELFAGDTARYLPTGHIVYGLGNNLLAVPFDLKALKVTGGPVPLVEEVWRATGAPQYAVSDSGTLVYVQGAAFKLPSYYQRTLVWVDRNGKEEPLAAPQNGYANPRISPDGTRVALAVIAGGSTDIWIWDLVRKTLPRLTFDADLDAMPLWTPDGKRIAYLSRRQQAYGVYWKAADGTGNDELLSPQGRYLPPAAWSRDGKALVVQEVSRSSIASGNLFDIGVLLVEGDPKWKPLLKEEKYNEVQPRISPNGRWMAYTSNESGKNEVYVRPFPEVDKGRWQVSTAGGDSPLWSRDGREMFYRNGDTVMAVPAKTDPIFSPEIPRVLFRGNYVSSSFNFPVLELSPWDISADGRRFLMMKEAGSGTPASEGPRKINIVINWFEELKRRVPTGKN